MLTRREMRFSTCWRRSRERPEKQKIGSQRGGGRGSCDKKPRKNPFRNMRRDMKPLSSMPAVGVGPNERTRRHGGAKKKLHFRPRPRRWLRTSQMPCRRARRKRLRDIRGSENPHFILAGVTGSDDGDRCDGGGQGGLRQVR